MRIGQRAIPRTRQEVYEPLLGDEDDRGLLTRFNVGGFAWAGVRLAEALLENA